MAKKKKSWVDKLKKKVKKIFDRERKKNQDYRDRRFAEKLKKQGLTEEQIKKLGFGEKR